MAVTEITREMFTEQWPPGPEDGFAKTFLSKCDMLRAWDRCLGVTELTADYRSHVRAAIVTTISKRLPRVANLQLLHTFAAHRGRGFARRLCELSVEKSHESGAQYFRVSSEPESVEFYRKIGFRFWGSQKSGCLLSIFRIGGPGIRDGLYEAADPVILAALRSGRKGSVVEMFEEPH